MKKTILGVKIDDISKEEVCDRVRNWLSKFGKSFGKTQDKHYIVTPNPEIVVMAQKDRELKDILNRADLAIPDGVGLKLAGDIVMTTPGIDVMEELVKMAEEEGFTVGLLGGRGEVAVKCAERLKKKYPKLKVSFATSGGEVDDQGQWSGSSSRKKPLASPERSLDVRFAPGSNWIMGKAVRKAAPHFLTDSDFAIPPTDLLFVAFGPPKQEKWIAKNLSKLPIKVAMGVGGAFDVISGQVPRAPIWIRHLGFEWLFRLCFQPWRIKRQLALIRYLYLVLRG